MVGTTKRSANSTKDDNNVSPADKRSTRSVNKEEMPAVQTPNKAVGRPRKTQESSPDQSSIKTTRSRACKEQSSSIKVSETMTPTKSGTARSKHLLVSPVPLAQPQTPTRSKRIIDMQTPSRRSRRLSVDSVEVAAASVEPPGGIETPTKRLKRLSTHAGENVVADSGGPAGGGTETPTKRQRRLSTNVGETDSPQVQTPSRRSRRLSTGSESSNVPESLPQKLEFLPRRTRRLSIEIIDSPIPQGARTPTRRSRRLSTDLEDTVTDEKTVLTPTRRSRRLSSGDQDVLDENIPKVLQNKSLKSLSSVDCSSNKANASARRSRRLSGSGLIEKPLEILEEEVEKEGDKEDEILHISKVKDDGLGVIVEDEKENEGFLAADKKNDILEVIAEDDQEEETSTASKPKNDNLNVMIDDKENEPEVTFVRTITEKEFDVIVEKKLNGDDEIVVEDSCPKLQQEDSWPKLQQEDSCPKVQLEDSCPKVQLEDSCPKLQLEDSCPKVQLEDSCPNLQLEDSCPTVQLEDSCPKVQLEDSCPNQQLEDSCPKLLLEDEKSSDDEVTFIEEKESEVKICSPTKRSPISSSQKKRKASSPVKLTEANVSSSGSITAGAPLSTESDVASTLVKSASATSVDPSSDDAQSKTVANELNGEPKATSSPAVKDSEKIDSFSSTCAEGQQNNKEKKLNTIPKESNNNSLKAKAPDVRGMPASGRWWKEERKRFNSIYKDEGPRSSWSDKMKRKQQLKDFLSLKNEIIEEKKMKKAQLRERQRLNTVRREENARKSEVVQVIKDSRKIKKMKRKQLRYIETRDTSLLK